MIVVTAAVLDANRFGYGDGYIVDVAAVPDRFEEGIGKTERQDVLHRLLAEIVINPEDLAFIETGRKDRVEETG